MKKKLLVIANFVTLPWEKGNSRFTYLISLLDKEKFDVELITSSFSHGDKKQRNDLSHQFTDYKITLIKEPGYKKNVSIKRFFSHYVFAKNVKKYLKSIEKPDIIYCAVPSLDVAKVAKDYAKENNVRFIIDIQDLWPEAFRMVFNIPKISDLIFNPMEKKANEIYAEADDIVAVSNTYADRAGRVNKKYGEKIGVFLGTDLEYFDKSKEKNEIVTFDDVVRVAYIGTLGHSYDLKCIMDALKKLQKKGIKNILFVIMGNGPLKGEFEKYARENGVNCEFTGRLNYEEMVGYLCACDIAVNPIRKGAAQSIINKVGDYAAAGLPVISTQECTEYQKLVDDYQIGCNVENDDIEELAYRIEFLYTNEQFRKQLGNNNRLLAEEKFDRRVTYKEIVRLIEKDFYMNDKANYKI